MERTNPTIVFGEPQTPPDDPAEEELHQLQAEVGVFGSAEVWQLTLDFFAAIRQFYVAPGTLDLARRQSATVEPWQQLDERRAEVRDLHTKIRAQMQAEIETL